MRTEEQCKPSERYLFAAEYFSDNAISIWKSECIKRCKEKTKGEAYYKYRSNGHLLGYFGDDAS